MTGLAGFIPDWLDPCGSSPSPPLGKGRYRVARYTDAVLAPLRQRGDPQTDRLFDLVAAGTGPGDPRMPVERVQDFLTILRAQDYFDISQFQGLPYTAALDAWAQAVGLPAGTDRSALDRAATYFVSGFFELVLIYSTSSLLNAYACRNGVEVLHSTKQLSKHANRRLAQTLQLAIYVCAPEGFRPNGHALDAIRKIRLMHGGVRYVVSRDPQYDQLACGTPVNGEDLLGMTMGFSALALAGMQKLFRRPTREESADYIQLWNVVGRLLGAEVGLLPRNEDEAFALFDTIMRRQQAPSADGAEMASALVAFHRHFLGPLVNTVGIGVMRYLAGDRVCDMLGLQPVGPFAAVSLLDLVGLVEDWGCAVIGHNGTRIGGLVVKPYQIPPSLAALWP